MTRGRQIELRIGFVAVLCGGLLLWSRARTPRSVDLIIDLTDALPGEITEIDVVVRRGGSGLLRVDRRFALGSAPQKVHLQVRALQGPAEVETTLVYSGKPARRSQTTVELDEEHPAVMPAR